MLPQGRLSTQSNYTAARQPSKTYKLDVAAGHIRGMTDNLAAMEQAVYKILATERYWYDIYTANYGVELDALIGTQRSYIKGDIARRLKEALLADDRILSVSDISTDFDKESVSVSAIARTIYGDVTIDRRVAVG